MASIKITVDKNVYRRPVAANDRAASGYVAAGSVVEISDIVFGKPIEDNHIWFRSVDGYYLWSGCLHVRNSNFVFPGKDFKKLSPENQYQLCSQALRTCGDAWRKEYPELTVLSVAVKRQGNLTTNLFSVVFHAEFKGGNYSRSFPANVRLLGFEIPTDVRQASPPHLCLGPGSEITKPDYAETGTTGFIVKKMDSYFLVTCYHVLCNDLRLNSIKMLFENSWPGYNRRVVVSGSGNEVGRIVSGMFTDFTDCIKVKLHNPPANTGSLFKMSGVKFIKELINLTPDQSTVTMLGAVSTATLSGKIESVNSEFQVPGSTHKFSGLIKAGFVAQPGDSGGPVVTSGGELIGIVAATDGCQYSYIIPIATILGNLGFNPKQIILNPFI